MFSSSWSGLRGGHLRNARQETPQKFLKVDVRQHCRRPPALMAQTIRRHLVRLHARARR